MEKIYQIFLWIKKYVYICIIKINKGYDKLNSEHIADFNYYPLAKEAGKKVCVH